MGGLNHAEIIIVGNIVRDGIAAAQRIPALFFCEIQQHAGCTYHVLIYVQLLLSQEKRYGVNFYKNPLFH